MFRVRWKDRATHVISNGKLTAQVEWATTSIEMNFGSFKWAAQYVRPASAEMDGQAPVRIVDHQMVIRLALVVAALGLWRRNGR